MKLTRQEIILLSSVVIALIVGGFVKHYRATHPTTPPTASPTPKRK